MAILIKNYVTEYGMAISEVYCKVVTYNYNATTKDLLFELKPYANETMANEDKPLPLPELYLGGFISNVAKSSNMIRKCYDYIHAKSTLMEGMSKEEVDAKAIADEHEYVEAVKWYPFIGSEDV